VGPDEWKTIDEGVDTGKDCLYVVKKRMLFDPDGGESPVTRANSARNHCNHVYTAAKEWTFRASI
jgi:hypothetical protein